MSNKPVIGKDCVLAMFDIADWAAPEFTNIENAKNVSQPGISKNTVSLASRGSKGWDLKGGALKSMDLQFEYLFETEDTVLTTLREAWLNDTVMGFAVLSGPSDGEFPVGTPAGDVYDIEGWKFAGIVTEVPTSEELEEGKTFDIKVEAGRYKLSSVLLLPTWVIIAGAAAT